MYELMEAEGVTVSAGVPTIWLALIQHVEQHGLRFSTMRRTIVGGTAMPPALIAKFADVYGVEVRHGWGMTETSGGITLSSLNAEQCALPAAAQHAIIARQGSVFFGSELRIVDATGAALPHDGVAQGELQARGLAVISRYFKETTSPLVDGWFPTGDIATIDAQGSVQIRDRVKDLIKSGGEWISSIDLENAAMGASRGGRWPRSLASSTPRWDERPLLFVVRKPDQPVEREDILALLATRVAKWWIPDGRHLRAVAPPRRHRQSAKKPRCASNTPTSTPDLRPLTGDGWLARKDCFGGSHCGRARRFGEPLSLWKPLLEEEDYQGRRRTGKEHEVRRVRDESVANRQERMGIAEHDAIARRPFWIRCEQIGYPPSSDLTEEKHHIRNPKPAAEPVRIGAPEIPHTEIQAYRPRQALYDRHSDETAESVLAAHSGYVIQPAERNPIMNP